MKSFRCIANFHNAHIFIEDAIEFVSEIYVVEISGKHRIRQINVDNLPSCVYACPHDAAHRMTGGELMTLSIRRADRLAGTKS